MRKEILLGKYKSVVNARSIGSYISIGFGCTTFLFFLIPNAYSATQASNCAVGLFSSQPGFAEFVAPGFGLLEGEPNISINDIGLEVETCFSSPDSEGNLLSQITLESPINLPNVCSLDSTIVAIPDSEPFFLTIHNIPDDTFCSYEFTLASTSSSVVAQINSSAIPNNPTAVPIFTPLGILATISGFLWFGNRRSLKLKRTNSSS